MISLSLPLSLIPPIPPHKSLSSSEEEIVLKRKELLSKFTSAISRNKLILSLPVVESFFKNSTNENISKTKDFYKKKIKKLERPDQFFSKNGVIECSIANKSEHAEQLFNYSSNAETIEKRLKRQSSCVMKDIKALAETYNNISELFHQLEGLDDLLPCKTNGKSLFNHLNSAFFALSKQEYERQQNFKKHFNMYFKYSYLEKDEMKNLLKLREGFYSEFLKAENKQKNLERHRNMFGCYNIHSLEEVERVIQEENVLVNKNFYSFARESANITSVLHNIWSNLIENV